MKRKVAIEDGLQNVKDMLVRQGFDVSSFEENKGNLDQFDAIIVSGQDDNVMGISSTLTKAPVIDASGKSATEIHNQLRNTLK